MSSKNKNQRHTPGPWNESATVFHPQLRDMVTDISNGQQQVGRLIQAETRERGEVYANARLIASAPELLKALKWALSDMERTAAVNATSPESIASICAARLAIDKAEGREE